VLGIDLRRGGTAWGNVLRIVGGGVFFG